MKIITFNILKPLALTALFVVFAAGFNTAEAKSCKSKHECSGGVCQKNYMWDKTGTCVSKDKYEREQRMQFD